MKTWKAILALMLVICMMTALFAACSKSGESENPGSNPGSNPASVDTVDPEDVTDINVYYFTSGGFVNDKTAVEEAINAISEKKAGVHVTLNPYDIGAYMGTMPVSMGAGERIDVMVRAFGPLGFAALCANKQMMPLDDLLDNYGKELKEEVGPYLEALRVDGQLYGIPPYRVYNANVYLAMRADMLREMGLYEKAQTVHTWSEYEEILQAVKDNYTGIYGTILGVDTENFILYGNDFSESYSYDNCGDTSRIVGAFDDQMKCIFDVDDKVDQLMRYTKWMNAGYVYPDSPYLTEIGSSYVKQGVVFSEVVISEVGVETARLNATGFENLCVEVAPIAIGTSQVQKFGVSIPVTCEEPEAVMKFLNLLYTDKEVANLFILGIEGTDYVIGESGEADFVNGDRATAQYHMDEYALGNQFILHPWAGQGANFRETSLANMKAAPLSPYFGFALDANGMDNTIAAMNAVMDEVSKSLFGGICDDALLERTRSKLKTAGIDEYVGAMQEQLDAWLASK